LLPYLDDANLERGYDYSQSPLAPANLTITYRVMKLFRSPSMNSPAHASGAIDQQRGWSSYAFCIGDNDAWGPGPDTGAIVRSGVMPNSPIRLSEIASADGCSTTLAAGEMGFQLDDYLFTSGPNSGKIRGGNTWWAFGYASYSFGSTNMGFNTTEGTAADLLLRLQTFRSDRSLGANFLFVDGSVRLLRPSLPLADYRALGTRNGSESVSLVGAER
jgi:prepilin-type processing-associated H-X9-DG protein